MDSKGISAALTAKAQGNDFFRAGDCTKAAKCYAQAIILVTPIAHESAAGLVILLSALANSSLCFIKLGRFGDARENAEAALELRSACRCKPEVATKAALHLAMAAQKDPAAGGLITARRAILEARNWVRHRSSKSLRKHVEAAREAAGVMTPADARKANCLVCRNFDLYEKGQYHPDCSDEDGITPLALAVETKNLQALVKLLAMGAQVDVREWREDYTPLLVAANSGWEEGVRVLLEAGANPLATDASRSSTLHACTVNYDHARHHGILERLLEAGANVNAINIMGHSPLSYLGERKACVELIQRLLDAGADPRGPVCTFLGYNSYMFVHRFCGENSEQAKLLRTAAARASTAHAEGVDQDMRVMKMRALLDQQVKQDNAWRDNPGPVVNRHGFDSDHGEVEQKKSFVKSLLRQSGLPKKAMNSAAGNPLQKVWNFVHARTPAVLGMHFGRGDAPSENVMQWLKCLGREALKAQPFTVSIHHPERKMIPTVAQDVMQMVVLPLQRVFAFAIPSDAALQALAHVARQVGGLVELGAGTGYWASLLRHPPHSVDVVAFDIQPPGPDMKNLFFHATFTKVCKGGAEVLKKHSDRALLLSYPFCRELHERSGDSLPWDVEALQAYTGPCVCHAGDLAEVSTRTWTSSPALKRALKRDWLLQRTVQLPRWFNSNDALTIWRRKTYLCE